MKQIGTNRNVVYLFIVRVESIDRYLYSSGLGNLLGGANSEPRFCRKKHCHVTADKSLPIH